MSQANNAVVEALLADIGSTQGDLLAIVQQVRRIAAESGNGVTESVKYGGIMFSHSQFFCGVFAYRNHVTVEFRPRAPTGRSLSAALKAAASIGGTSSSTRPTR